MDYMDWEPFYNCWIKEGLPASGGGEGIPFVPLLWKGRPLWQSVGLGSLPRWEGRAGQEAFAEPCRSCRVTGWRMNISSPGIIPSGGCWWHVPALVSLPGVVGLMLGQLVELLFLLSLLCLVGSLFGFLPAHSRCLCPLFLAGLAGSSHSFCTVVDLALACVVSSRSYVLLIPSDRSPQLLNWSSDILPKAALTIYTGKPT